MKASIYVNYTTRSLVRGGQRTVLAIFCVAVGVMAIVALQLVGLMVNHALTDNVRAANGGDIAVNARSQPFKQSDLKFFDTLKQNGTISAYTQVINASGSTSSALALKQTFTLNAVDPATYPVVDQLTFNTPQNGSVKTLLQPGQALITQTLADQYHKKIGQQFEIRVAGGSGTQTTRKLTVKISGIVAESGVLAQAGALMLVTQADYTASNRKFPVFYDTIDITTVDKVHTDRAVRQINDQFQAVTTQTAADALRQQQGLVDNIEKFLEIAGLLALLIGGVGIVNTMQVLLSRRKVEIAMLKTTGYRRGDLYLLFGLEATLLGLVGGLVGAISATGVSYLVRDLVQQTFGLMIPFVLDWTTIGGGVLIGVLTALIFGLLPIVQGANIRPLNVIRELPDGRGASSILLTILLLIVLSVLFCGLAIFILNNDVWLGVVAVYGAFAFLGVLSLLFGLMILLISRLPVPEHFSLTHFILVVGSVILSLLVYRFAPAFGILLLIFSALGLLVAFFPRTWKATIKMALRNLGRQRTRTTTTMLALFVGIFTIGLILVLGQNLRDGVNSALSNSLNFNVITLASIPDGNTLNGQLGTVPGLKSSRRTTISPAVPVAVNKRPIQQVLPASGKAGGSNSLGRQGTLAFLRGIEGYDVGDNQLPNTKDLKITQGRNLVSEDAGTNNVLVASQLARLDPLHLKIGDTLTMASQDGRTIKTLKIVGVYSSQGFSGFTFEPILGSAELAQSFSPAGLGQQAFYMKLDPKQVSQGVSKIGTIVPNAAVVNLANISDIIDQILNDILLTLTTIASLSLLAGVIIIANAVALAMLERRRELGILKSVGYTSGTVLSEVLVENGIVGGVGALLAMVLVTVATALLGQYTFKTSFSVPTMIVLELILGAALLAMVTAALVAWRAVRVRPLQVLRYE